VGYSPSLYLASEAWVSRDRKTGSSPDRADTRPLPHHRRDRRRGELEHLTDYDDSTLIVDYPSWSSDASKGYFSLTRKVGDLILIESRGHQRRGPARRLIWLSPGSYSTDFGSQAYNS